MIHRVTEKITLYLCIHIKKYSYQYNLDAGVRKKDSEGKVGNLYYQYKKNVITFLLVIRICSIFFGLICMIFLLLLKVTYFWSGLVL